MDDKQMEKRLAWRSMYEQRLCPPDEILFSGQPSEELESHLEFCQFCSERLDMSEEERAAWQKLQDVMRQDIAPEVKEQSPKPGQIWSLKQEMLGGWGAGNFYYTVPLVLLLKPEYDGNAFKVAQLFYSQELVADGDIQLPEDSGIAETWNTYLIHRKHLKSCMGFAGEVVARKVLLQSTASFTPAIDPVIEDFRQFERDVAKAIADRAAVLVSAEQPKLHAGMFEAFAWMFTPARIAALAAMIVAVISIAILQNNKVQQSQIAQHQKPTAPEPVVPPVTQKPGAVSPEAPKRVSKPLTLMACADVVMMSKGITSVESLEFTRSGTDSTDKGIAAFKAGVAFVNLVAAEKSKDENARSEVAGQLEYLLSKITGNQEIRIPAHLIEKQPLAAFTRVIEQAASKSGQLTNLQFGSWLQSMRVADDKQLLKSMSSETIAYFKTKLEKQKQNSLAIPILDKMQALLGSNKVKPEDIRRYLEELNDVY